MNAVGIGILYLVLGNMVAVFSDALVKVLEPDQPVFQFVFFRQLSAAILLAPWLLWSWRRNPPVALKWHLLRAHIWAVGVCLMVIALTRLPLATANALFYAAPLMMVPLAVWLAGKRSAPEGADRLHRLCRGADRAASHRGELGGAGGARGGALHGAQQSADQADPAPAAHRPDPVLYQRVEHAFHHGAGLVGRGDWQWQMWWPAFGSSALIMVYAGLCVVAYRKAEASKIASAEYTGLLMAVAIGVWLFDEQPGLPLLLGCLCIILPLIAMARSKPKPQVEPAL